jgi:hypothetical protein
MRPSEGLISLWPVVVVAIIMVLGGFSISPVTKLQNEAPPDFTSVRVFGRPPDAALASQYWQIAVRITQWKYNRTASLPNQVPADFRMLTNLGTYPTLQEQQERIAYWDKLRDEWTRPDNWRTTYTFDLHWALRGARTLADDAMRFIRQNQ